MASEKRGEKITNANLRSMYVVGETDLVQITGLDIGSFLRVTTTTTTTTTNYSMKYLLVVFVVDCVPGSSTCCTLYSYS